MTISLFFTLQFIFYHIKIEIIFYIRHIGKEVWTKSPNIHSSLFMKKWNLWILKFLKFRSLKEKLIGINSHCFYFIIGFQIIFFKLAMCFMCVLISQCVSYLIMLHASVCWTIFKSERHAEARYMSCAPHQSKVQVIKYYWFICGLWTLSRFRRSKGAWPVPCLVLWQAPLRALQHWSVWWFEQCTCYRCINMVWTRGVAHTSLSPRSSPPLILDFYSLQLIMSLKLVFVVNVTQFYLLLHSIKISNMYLIDILCI